MDFNLKTGYGLSMKRFGISLAAAVLATILLCGAALAGAPTDRIKQGVEKVIAILQDPKYKGAKNIQGEQLDRLRGAFKDYFDFTELTARAVGRPWLKFTPTQQQGLAQGLQELLEKTYIGRFEGYNGEKFTFSGEVTQGNVGYVQSQVMTVDNKTISMVFRVIQKDGAWYVYDVVAEGVSVMEIYRSQFAQVLQSGTPDELIARVRQRVQEIAGGKTVTDEKTILTGSGGAAN